MTDVPLIWTFVLMSRKEIYTEAHNIPGPDEIRTGLWVSSAGHYRSRHHQQAPRIREDHLLVYCNKGGGTYQIGQCRFLISEGDCFVCFPGVLHEYASDPTVGWDIHWVHFGGERAAELIHLVGIQLSQPVLGVGRKGELTKHIPALRTLLSRHDDRGGLDASALLYQLLLGLRHQTRDWQIRREGIENALRGEPTSVAAMAAACSLSRSHFTRKFQRATGISPWRYIMTRRIIRAKDLLSNTDLSIKEIAVRVGFEDPNYFSRLFHKETGSSPTEFRSARVQIKP